MWVKERRHGAIMSSKYNIDESHGMMHSMNVQLQKQLLEHSNNLLEKDNKLIEQMRTRLGGSSVRHFHGIFSAF